MTEKRPPCPKCGKPMVLNGSTSSSGKKRWICRQGGGDRTFCHTTVNPESGRVNTQSGKNAKEKSKPKRYVRTLRGVTRFLVSSAQNATPEHEGFVNALEAARKWFGYASTEIVVVPTRYKNPTSRWTESQANEEQWAPRLAPYLFNQRRKLNDNLVLLGDIKTQPTATSPLQGFETITHGESGILGHNKLQLRVIPTPQSKFPKILTTTGSCTVPNYTDSKAGKKGEFHHVLGAVMVELEGNRFHLRQINAKSDGSFIDLDREFLPRGKEVGMGMPYSLGVIFGDKHVRSIDKKVERATFGPGGIVETLNPQVLVYHDLLDGYAVNPHHRKAADPFLAQAKYRASMEDIREEVLEAVAFVVARTKGRESVIVPSNHNDFLRRWLVDIDWRKDPRNAKFYLETALHLVEHAKMTPHGAEYPDPFAYWVDRLIDSTNISCIGKDESFTLADIECGYHGDHGPNGARGTMSNLAKIGVKIIDGHSHTPGIEHGHYRVGTSTALKAEYTNGPSSWLNTHCVVYSNGKRSLINIINGHWRREN